MVVLQDEPLSPEDDVDRQLKASKTKSIEDDSAEIEAASFKKFPVEVNSLTRVRGVAGVCGLGSHLVPLHIRPGHLWDECPRKIGWNGCGGWGWSY